MLVERMVGRTPRLPQGFDRATSFSSPAKASSNCRCVEAHQRALIVLAMDFDQRGTDRFQGLHADRLVVDEGAGAGVGKLHAAENHLTGMVGAVFDRILVGRMALGDVESGHHLALLRAMANKAQNRRGRRAPARRTSNDGFARAGLAGQHREATGNSIDPLDQDDVTDRQTRQHAR